MRIRFVCALRLLRDIFCYGRKEYEYEILALPTGFIKNEIIAYTQMLEEIVSDNNPFIPNECQP